MDRIEAGINALSSQEFKTFEEWADCLDKEAVTPKMVVVYHALLESLVNGLNKDVPEIDLAVISELREYSVKMRKYIDDAVKAVSSDIPLVSHVVKSATHDEERYMLACWLDDMLTDTKAFWYVSGGSAWEVAFRGKAIIPVGTLTTKYKKPTLSHSVFCDSALEALRVQKKMKDDFNKSLVFDNQSEE